VRPDLGAGLPDPGDKKEQVSNWAQFYLYAQFTLKM